jgi:hypothetical protein
MYLLGYDKARLLGIAHEAYVRTCADYDVNNITKYAYSLLEKDGEYALDVADGEDLPDVFKSKLVDKEVMIQNGWSYYFDEGV